MYSWTTILSPRSLTALSSPLMLYYKSYLAVAIGSTLTEKVIYYSYAFSARMDERMTSVGDLTELERDLKSFFYPTLGILRGLVSAGLSEEEAEKIVTSMLDFAPSDFFL